MPTLQPRKTRVASYVWGTFLVQCLFGSTTSLSFSPQLEVPLTWITSMCQLVRLRNPQIRHKVAVDIRRGRLVSRPLERQMKGPLRPQRAVAGAGRIVTVLTCGQERADSCLERDANFSSCGLPPACCI
jgi:hypothetical protein